MKEIITSLQNPKIKQIDKIRKSSGKKDEDLTIVEGMKELSLALGAGFDIKTVFYCKEFSKNRELPVGIKDDLVLEVDAKVFKKIAYRENPDGFLALVKKKYLKLEDIELKKNPLIIILESVEKPGNLGAILRSADAASVDALLICDPRTDIYNTNVIRASLGTVFTKQVVACTNEEALEWLKKNKIKSFAATPDTDKIYTKVDFKKGSAIIIGTEHEGLSAEWLKRADEKIKIPMMGKIDSLNASVSAAIMVFEAVRQRAVD